MAKGFDRKLVDEIVDKLQRFGGSSCTCKDCAKVMASDILNLLADRMPEVIGPIPLQRPHDWLGTLEYEGLAAWMAGDARGYAWIVCQWLLGMREESDARE